MYYSYNGYLSVNPLTSSIAFALFASTSSTSIAIASATISISASLKPLVVTAAVPSLIPLVTNGEAGSFGIVFLLHVMLAASKSFLLPYL